jgi:hypothetical protein
MLKMVTTGVPGKPVRGEENRRWKRELTNNEAETDCPKCKARAGKPCTYDWHGKLGVSAGAHVERKRTYQRQLRLAKIRDILAKHHPSSPVENADIAVQIMNALSGVLLPDGTYAVEPETSW